MSVAIPVCGLARLCNPLRADVWGTRVTREDVAQALAERRLVATPGTEDHAGRIAFLVENNHEDPIEVDVGIPVLGFHMAWPVTDGNHRLAAAIYAGREVIEAEISRQLDYAKRLFGVECQESMDVARK